MAWVLTVGLTTVRTEFNVVFPVRYKHSDGSIGDQAHASGKSGHNPDKTGNAEYKDGDSLDEVRAIDVDKDLVPGSGTDWMELVVQHIVTNARNGVYVPFRYIIYKRRIWSRTSGWATQTYTGSNPHNEHAHFSGDYTQKADNWTGSLGLASVYGGDMDQDTFNDRMDAWVNRTLAAPDTADSGIVAVRNKIRAVVWQYVGGGIPAGKSTLGTLAGAHDYSKVTAEGLDEVSPETIDQIEAAAYSGAEAGAAAGVDPAAIASAVLAGLQAAGLDPTLYAEAVEDAVRAVFADAGTE